MNKLETVHRICVGNLFVKFQLENFARSFTTSIVCRYNDFDEDNLIDFSGETKQTKKVIGIKTRFLPNQNGPPKIIEGKYAATVIKKFNWECKNLYGPLLESKTNPGKRKYLKDVPIIQHQSVVPVLDPLKQDKSNQEKSYLNDLYSKDSIFNTLLNFPLVNKPTTNANTLQVTELNILRKELEMLGDSHKPSVTAILEKTMSEERAEILRRWREKMIKELGEEGFQKYQSELFANGTALHDYINRYLTSASDAEEIANDAIKGYVKSLKSVFPNVKEIKLMEERISHPFLHYKGVVDCFAKYRDQLVVIEWKTSKKTKSTLSNTFDNPLQVAAYVGALNFDPKFQYMANKGLLVIAYENGNPASLLMIDEERMTFYWKEWLNRVKLYWETKYMDKISSN